MSDRGWPEQTARPGSGTISLQEKAFDLIGRCLKGCVPGQALLRCFEEFLRPAVIQAPSDALAAAQLGNTVLALQAIQHDLDLLIR